ncbi:MAG: hypothetical protein H6622_18110 [Halobacteriovoraceae bacterium]|nr:hypothetical protein [Halobacteriovoraceae bacterium]
MRYLNKLGPDRPVLKVTTALCFCLFSGIGQAGEAFTKDCNEKLLISKTSKEVMKDVSMRLETYKLSDLLVANKEKNVFYKSPVNVMGAAQFLQAMIEEAGFTEKNIPGEGRVREYAFFSSGTEKTDGRMIIDNERNIHNLVNQIKASNSGNRKVPLLIGPAGTGKSEILSIIAAGTKWYSSNNDKFKLFTFKWKNLHEIDDLHRFLLKIGSKVNPERVDPMNSSPFTILPPGMQKAVLEFVSPAVKEMIDSSPNPVYKTSPFSAEIVKFIVAHHQKGKSNQAITEEEYLDILDKHIEIIRVEKEISGKVNAQGKEYSKADLYNSPNALVAFKSGEGSNHPLNWNYDGQYLRSNRGALYLDEFFRNPSELRDMALHITQERELVVGGAPDTPLDTNIFAASNFESVEKVLADANGTGGKAQLDRFSEQRWLWLIRPTSAAKLTVLSAKQPVFMRKLGEGERSKEENEIHTANLSELWPRAEVGEKPKTPADRYELFIGEGEDQIHVAPHVIDYIGQVLVATRANTNPSEASAEANYDVINKPLFKNIVTRIQYYLGDMPSVTAAEGKELQNLSVLLMEGNFGISQRDAEDWIIESVNRALEPGNNKCLDIFIVQSVFKDLLMQGRIKSKDARERIEWEGIAAQIAEKIYLPKVNGDVFSSLNVEHGSADRIYREVVEDMLNLSQGKSEEVEQERLREIGKIYFDNEFDNLNIQQITAFHMEEARRGNTSLYDSKDPALMRAVQKWIAKKASQSVSLFSIGDYLRGNKTDSDTANTTEKLVHHMSEKHGYCPHCVKTAIQLRNQQERKEAEAND